MLEKALYNFWIAVESISFNKLRALLTSLGIVFGVASVISMLAIGRGAQNEILEQIKLLGANNIIITPIVEQEEGEVTEEDTSPTEKKPFSPGLSLADATSIAHLIPGVELVNPEVVIETTALRSGLRRSTKLVGVGAHHFEETGFELSEGAFFTDDHFEQMAPVAIIGYDVKTKFFAKEEAIGNRIKCGNLWLTVVGVMQPRNIEDRYVERLGIRNYDLDIYTPISTLLLRYENRAQITQRDIAENNQNMQNGGARRDPNYHQLDRLVVRVADSRFMGPVAEVSSRMLERRHNGVVDFEVTIPEVLMQQERRTQNIFNIVLASIASISLLVGGIGIMNIMLASVLERIREIGVRRAIGATRQDIVLQFLIEAITISFSGGTLGVLLGIGTSLIIRQATGIMTSVSIASIVLAFLVSVSVGLAFGFFPAKRAAEQRPVEALRYE